MLLLQNQGDHTDQASTGKDKRTRTQPPSKLGHCSISDLAKKYDVSLRTIRFYEQQGLLRPVRIGHERFFGRKDETRLQAILKGKRLGFTLHEIGRMIGYVDRPQNDAESLRERQTIVDTMDRATLENQTRLLEQRRAEVDRAIEELKAALLDDKAIFR